MLTVPLEHAVSGAGTRMMWVPSKSCFRAVHKSYSWTMLTVVNSVARICQRLSNYSTARGLTRASTTIQPMG